MAMSPRERGRSVRPNTSDVVPELAIEQGDGSAVSDITDTMADQLAGSGSDYTFTAPQNPPPEGTDWTKYLDRLKGLESEYERGSAGFAQAEGAAKVEQARQAEALAGGLSEAQKRRAETARSAEGTYKERMAETPLPAFAPSEDNAQTLGALFSGINIIGALMSRGAGRNSAMSAMKSMTGMLEGYRTGRMDLYKRERDVFEKSYKRIQDIQTQFAKDMDRALKIAEVDLESGRAEAQYAAASAGIPIAEQLAKAGNFKALASTAKEVTGLIKAQTDLIAGEAARGIQAYQASTRAAGGSSTTERFQARILQSLVSASRNLESIANLPQFKDSPTLPAFAGLTSTDPNTLTGAIKSYAARKVTSEQARLFQSFAGQIAGGLAKIDSQGLATGASAGQIATYEGMTPRAGDSGINAAVYLSWIKQELKDGANVYRSQKGPNEAQRRLVDDMVKQIDRAVPFDLSKVMSSIRGTDKTLASQMDAYITSLNARRSKAQAEQPQVPRQ